MPKRARELSAVQVRRLVRPGLHSAGGVVGLYLQVRSPDARSWILNTVVGRARRQYGLGSYPTVPLDLAREKARAYRVAIENGQDPLNAKRTAKAALVMAAAKAMTFDEAARQVLGIKQQEFRNEKHAKQWEATLTTYASPIIGALPVSAIETSLILKILEPIWSMKTETATRLRQRIEKVLDWCAARGYRTGENPARWRGHLKELLPQPSKIRNVQHFAALTYRELPAFFARLQRQRGIAALALQFAILTAARSGEVRGATWGELDLPAQSWTISAERMKMEKEHRVPLSAAALAILAGLPRFHGSAFLFPSPSGETLSDTALLMVLRRMKVAAVPHGFRSTFKTWASEMTAFPRNLIEASMAHALENKTEAAYLRGDLFDKRRKLMHAWAVYCRSTQGQGNR